MIAYKRRATILIIARFNDPLDLSLPLIEPYESRETRSRSLLTDDIPETGSIIRYVYRLRKQRNLNTHKRSNAVYRGSLLDV